MKFLIVDDTPENLSVLELMLQKFGHKAVAASNGSEALEKLKSAKFDMIISDILMPVMDGYHLCYEVKNDASLKNIPFIFLSAIFTDKKDQERALKMGADAFLMKPIPTDKFMNTINTLAKEVKDGTYKAKRPGKEAEVSFKLHSEDMISKLEEKNRELEAADAECKKEQMDTEYSRKLLTDLIDNTDLLIYALDIDGKFILVNRELERIFNCSRDKLIGKTREAILPRTIADAHRKNDLQVIAEKKPVTIEETSDLPDGTHTYLSTKFPLIDGSGKVYAVCGISRDITESKKTDEIIRKSEEIYKLIFNSSKDVMARLDLTGKILDVNEVASTLGGWGRDEILGKNVATLASLFTPGSLALIMTNFAKALLGIDSGPYEVEGKTKDGRRVYLETNSIHMKDAKGKLYGILAVLHDITKSKTLEIELKNKLADLETYYKATMGREDKILELKKKIEELEKARGK